MMKAQYVDPINGTFEIDTPFRKLKMDEPLACAKYIREYITEHRRKDRPLNDWAAETIKQHNVIARRMHHVNPIWRSKYENEHTALMRDIKTYRLKQKLKSMRIRRNGPSRNQRWIQKKFKEKFGDANS